MKNIMGKRENKYIVLKVTTAANISRSMHCTL